MRSKMFGGLVVACVAAAIGAAPAVSSAQEQAPAVNRPAAEIGAMPGQPVVVWGDRGQPDEDGYGMFLVLTAGQEIG